MLKRRMTVLTPKIGEGVFLLKDVAQIVELPTSTVRRWLLEFWNEGFSADFSYHFGDDKNRAVNFYTLIEFIVFAKLREQNISAQKIKKFHGHLSKVFETHFPFAVTKLLTDKKDVWYQHYDSIIKIDGKNQFAIKKILEPFLLKIEFGQGDSGPIRYYPLGKSKKIVIDPKHQFGQPTILGTNIRAETIYSLYLGKEKRENICLLYNLSKQQVNDAIYYYRNLAA